MSKKKYKPGRLTNDEQKFIHENIYQYNYTELSEKLNKHPESIRKYCVKEGLAHDSSAQQSSLRYELETSPFYQSLKEQFTETELERIKKDWYEIKKQFKDDILYTEEMQILDVVKTSALMDRCLIMVKTAQEQIEALRDRNRQLRSIDPREISHTETAEIEHNNSTIYQLMANSTNCNKEYQNLLKEKKTLLDKIKGSRDQRIQSIEKRKETFGNLISSYLNKPSLRREIGLFIEKMRVSVDNEVIRLSELHEYQDGLIDQPLLNSKTVMQIEKDRIEEDEKE